MTTQQPATVVAAPGQAVGKTTCINGLKISNKMEILLYYSQMRKSVTDFASFELKE